MIRWPAAGALVTAVAFIAVQAGSAPGAGAVPFTLSVPGPPSSESVQLLDVPYVPQSEVLCGGAAAAMVLRYWGERGIHSESFASLVDPAGRGIRGDALASGVRALGWKAVCMSATPFEVKHHLSRGRPVIALIRSGSNRYHYVVVLAWGTGGVILHDPAIGPFRVVSDSWFERGWAASDRWVMLVLPPPRAPVAPGALANSEQVAEAVDKPARVAGASGHATLDGCDGLMRRGVERARGGDAAEAQRVFEAAASLCPSSALPWRELASLRFQAEDWSGAASLAERSLALNAEDPHTWRLLAASRYLGGNLDGALMAWNEVTEPRLDLTRVDGLRRTRYRIVADQIDLRPGSLLTSRAVLRARRRLSELPTESLSHLDLQPLHQGKAQVNAALVERPLLFGSPAEAGIAAVRALITGEAVIRVSSPFGAGELWTGAWRWKRERPRVAASLAVPAPSGLPGVLRAEGIWDRQTYSAGFGRTSEDWNRAAISFSDWAEPDARYEVGIAYDRFEGAGAYAALEGTLERRALRDRLAVALGLGQWLGTGSPIRAGELDARWGSKHIDHGPWTARAGVSMVSRRAPLALWPGAGTGTGRGALLRAHPLLHDGVVEGKGFGRALITAGAERKDWLVSLKAVRLGYAVFLDAARALHSRRSFHEPWIADAGMGLRLGGAGGLGGELRVDAAHGLVDDESAISVRWESR